MKDMKLIMETWRKFESISNDKETHVFLFENSEPVKTNFNVLLEQYDDKSITEEQLVSLWEASFDYEHEQLLNEIEALKKAGALAGKIKEKVADWMLKSSIQLVEMAKRGVGLAAKLGKKLLSVVGRFKESHPLIFKVVSVIVLSAGMFALMAVLDSPEAQAAIMPAGGEETAVPTGKGGGISSGAYEALRGLVHESDASGSAKTKAMALIDKIQKSKEVVDLSQMKTEFGQLAKAQNETLEGLFRLAKGAGGAERDQEAAEYLLKMIDIGKKVTYKIGGMPTR